MKISAEEILKAVTEVISSAFHGSRTTPSWLMAIQVMNRLPVEIQLRLVADHGMPGKGSGNNHAGSHVVKDALLMLHRAGIVAVDYLDANGEVSIDCIDETVKPGDLTVAIYRFVG